MRKIALFALLWICVDSSAQQQGTVQLAGPVQKIADQAPHSAFTDLVRFQDKFYCVFREGADHAAGAGKIRVLVSNDGENWQSAALLAKENVDLRDPHLCITPDGRLMLNGGAAYPHTRNPVKDHYSWVSFSKDGMNWSAPQKVLDSWHWMWRITWHKGTAYGVAYIWDPAKPGATNYRTVLYRSKDGINYEKLCDLVKEYASEASLQFDGDTMYCLLRRDGYKAITALLGTSQPPYTEWTWKDLGTYLGGPDMVRDPSGNWWAAGRIYNNGAKTAVGRLDVERGKFSPSLTLPSGGDTSYPGMLWHDGQLWICYYSGHEGKTSIYLAKLKVATP